LILHDFFQLARSLHCIVHRPIGGAKKGSFEMIATLSPIRQTAVSFAGALIASLLFVSAAVGPLPFIA
jgi:hypothetical protein